MGDGVDTRGLHDAGEDRVVLVGADVLGALELHRGLAGVEADDDLDVRIGFERRRNVGLSDVEPPAPHLERPQRRQLLVLAVTLSLPLEASAQRVVVRTGHRTRVTTVVAPAGGTAVVVNPPGRGNTTVVRTGRRGNTVVNTPGPGRVVIRH